MQPCRQLIDDVNIGNGEYCNYLMMMYNFYNYFVMVIINEQQVFQKHCYGILVYCGCSESLLMTWLSSLTHWRVRYSLCQVVAELTMTFIMTLPKPPGSGQRWVGLFGN